VVDNGITYPDPADLPGNPPHHVTPVTADRTRRTTPTWAVVALMVVVALTVVASIPVSRALRGPRDEAARLVRLTDLIHRERDFALDTPSGGLGSLDATRAAVASHATRHAAIDQVLVDLGSALPHALVVHIGAFGALVDQQHELAPDAAAAAARALDRVRVEAAYQEILGELDTLAALADVAAAEAEVLESLALAVRALLAMAVVLALFLVLQRRNATVEFGAGRRDALNGEQRRLRALIAASSDLTIVLDAEGRVTWASPSVAAATGLPESQLLGTVLRGYLHPDDRERVVTELSALRRGEIASPFRIEYRILLGDRRRDERWLEVVAANAMDEPGINGIILNGRDITEQHDARAELQVRERDLRELMNHVNGVFYRSERGRDGRWTFVSPQIEQLLGYTAEEWIADPGLWARSIHPDDRERVLREEGPAPGAVDYRMVTRTGEARWVRDDATLMVTHGPTEPYWAGTLIDVTRAYQIEDELRHRAHHDALTRLPNRSLLLDRLANALDRSRRKPFDVGLIFVDLDDFKDVNDDLGHAAGDALLVAVGERLREAIRPGDTAARLGGDEFALLVDEVDRQELGLVADRVIRALDVPITIGTRQLHVTGSVGVAISMGAGTDPERMLRDADTAMYVAKREGKRRWVFFDPGMSGVHRERVRMESHLRRALAQDEFHLVYLPIVRLSDGRIEGAEALLRWHGPEAAGVDTQEFIAVAEEAGLMPDVGRWVLRQACLDAAMWQRYTRRGVWLAVNISARQLLDPGMVRSVVEALSDSGLAAGKLVLEMTENAALRDLDAAEQRLGELKAAGVRLAMDDFGAGTSSIGHLRRLTFDLIKIDRSVVGEVHRSPEGLDLVRSLVHISRTLRAQPLAEGVEDEDQVRLLRAAGCELGQGYLFGRPVEASVLRDALLHRDAEANAS